MSFLEAIVYGIIQGLSEFLPVSSSGHLALLPYVMKIDDPGVVFDLMMHLGTALAIVIYFWKDIKGYLGALNPSLFNMKVGGGNRWFVRNFFFSTFISILAIFALMPLSKYARSADVIVLNLSLFGAILWLADWVNSKKTSLLDSPMYGSLQLKVAGLIGLAQALAIFPGVSRSGITLTAALLLGMTRKDAGQFSFLLSLPIIFAGIIKEIPELMKTQDNDSLLILLTGVGTSFVVGYLTVHFFMSVIGKVQLKYFAFYRWIIAAIMMFVVL